MQGEAERALPAGRFALPEAACARLQVGAARSEAHAFVN
jgi:hypothetical protein